MYVCMYVSNIKESLHEMQITYNRSKFRNLWYGGANLSTIKQTACKKAPPLFFSLLGRPTPHKWIRVALWEIQN